MLRRTISARLVFWLICAASCVFAYQAQTRGDDDWEDVTSLKAVLVGDAFNVTLVAKEKGTLFYTDVTGKLGIGSTEEEARGNLSEPKVGEYSPQEGILYIELKQPFNGLRTIYFSAPSGRPRLHRVTWQLLNLQKFASKLPAPKALEKLAELCKDESALVRKPVAEALASGKGQAVEILVPLLKDKDISVRCAAARSLGAIKNERAVQALSEALKTAEPDSFRKTLADVMAGLKEK